MSLLETKHDGIYALLILLSTIYYTLSFIRKTSFCWQNINTNRPVHCKLQPCDNNYKMLEKGCLSASEDNISNQTLK